tara:strand:+ start:22649 stop:24757 length:2109 start_codon:yes stop_codon:yes gene_type:complete
MKWIGQHIWSFISRFRSDVYLEGTDSGTIASGGNLGLDSNNKIVKSASPSGEIDLTSEVTGTLPVANGGTGATSLTDNSVLTGTGTSPITAEANFTYSGTAMSLNAVTSTFTNAVASTVTIENTGSNSAAGVLKLANTKDGGNGDVSDIGGTIQFVAKNDGGAVAQIGEIRAEVTDPAAATHSSSLKFFLANEGALCDTDHPGIIIEGNTGTADVINTTLSHGVASTTTIAGDLDIDGDNMTAAGALTFTPGGLFKTVAAGVEIENGSTTGAPALLIDNDDVDQIALSIDAANTTADIISVTGNAMTTGSFINYTGVATGPNTNGLIDIDITNTDTTTTAATGISIDYNKSGVTAASQAAVFTGINIDYDDTATNNAAGISIVNGMVMNINNDSDQGVISQTGLNIWCTGADAASTSGILIRTPNGSNDLRIISQDSAADIFTIDTKEDGETTLTTVENAGGSTAHMNLVADGDIVLDSASGVIKTGSTTFVNNSGVIQVAGQTNITSVGTLTGLTTSGAIELGHADDTTLARSAAGIATIEGKQIFTTNVPALTSGAAGVPAVTMQTRRTITTAEANDMHNTTIELVPVQGANNVIVPIGGMIRVDRAGAQNQSACDLNMHIGNHPGAYFSTSLAHLRRFMVGELGDRIFSITAMMAATEVGQSLSGDANKPLQISFDSAATTDCFTSIDIFLTYQVISIA